MTKEELINKIKQTLTENPDKVITPAELEETMIDIVSSLDKLKMEWSYLDFKYAHAVDLGLPSGNLWSDINIGQTIRFEDNPANYKQGIERYWGVIDDLDAYPEELLEKYKGGNKVELDAADDIAIQLLGDGWRTPTIMDFEELDRNCSKELIGNGPNIKLIGKTGNYIIVSANNSALWTSSIDIAATKLPLAADWRVATSGPNRYVYFTRTAPGLNYRKRIRPVYKPKK